MEKRRKDVAIDRTFVLAMVLKGFDGTIEVLAGGLTLLAGVVRIHTILENLRLWTLATLSSGFISDYLLKFELSLNARSELFFSLFLLSHGIVKLFIVASVFRRKLWAYPIAIIVFSVFTVFQLFQLSQQFGMGLLILTVIDILVIILTALEYRNIRKGKTA